MIDLLKGTIEETRYVSLNSSSKIALDTLISELKNTAHGLTDPHVSWDEDDIYVIGTRKLSDDEKAYYIAEEKRRQEAKRNRDIDQLRQLRARYPDV